MGKGAKALFLAAALLCAKGAQAQYQQCPASTVMAGPQSGPPAAPTCRALVPSDIPPPVNTDPVNIKTISGAKGDGATDDTRAIQAAFDSLSTGGALLFPQGTYCIKTGPLTLNHWPITLIGDNREASVLSACGTDSAILVDKGFHNAYYRLHFDGSEVRGTTKDVITIDVTALPGYLVQTETTIEDCYITHGHIGVNSTSVEIYLKWSKITAQYGPAAVYLTEANIPTYGQWAGGYIFRVKMDQPWPVQPSSGTVPTPIAPWTATHAYTSGAMASVTGYILQATTGGTSGSTAPAPPRYGDTVQDGTVVWQTAKPNPYYGIWCDSGCGANAYFSYNDFSSVYDNAIYMSNTRALNNPFGLYINLNTFGALLQNGILIAAGLNIHMTDNSFGNCVGNPCTNISITGASSDISVIGGSMINGATGIYVGSGTGTLIEGVEIGVATTALSIGGGVGSVTAIGNKLGGSAVFGGNGTGVFIASGASDNIHIMGNDYAGASTPIQDARSSQGAHDIIVYNNQGVSCAGTPTAGFASSGGMVTHC